MPEILQIVLHLDVYLAGLTVQYGCWTYAILFLVIFSETGLVLFPFLPGDSLLFAAGAVAAIPGSAIDVVLLIVLLTFAAVVGNIVNYSIGLIVGPKIFSGPSRWLRTEHLKKTQ